VESYGYRLGSPRWSRRYCADQERSSCPTTKANRSTYLRRRRTEVEISLASRFLFLSLSLSFPQLLLNLLRPFLRYQYFKLSSPLSHFLDYPPCFFSYLFSLQSPISVQPLLSYDIQRISIPCRVQVRNLVAGKDLYPSSTSPPLLFCHQRRLQQFSVLPCLFHGAGVDTSSRRGRVPPRDLRRRGHHLL
jgi:hypothetical protein